MSDDGLDENAYMLQIKQLKYNYTSFDINKETPEKRQEILTTIKDLTQTEHSYEIIRSYEYAAHECKYKQDLGSDK